MRSEESEVLQTPLSERAILSQMVRDPVFYRRALVEGIEPDHFIRYRPVFEVVTTLGRSGATIDEATVSGALVQSGAIATVGGDAFVADLFAEANNGKGWRQWVRDLTAVYARRIMREGLELVADGKTPEQQLEAMRQTQELVKAALAGPSRAKSAKEAVALARLELDELIKAGVIPGIATGLGDLDDLTGGMKKGQLWSILAKTSRGKSVLMAQFANSALTVDKRTVIFSAEMMVYEVIFRAIAHRGKVDMQYLMSPRKAGRGWLERIKTQLDLLEDVPLWVDDTPRMTLAHIERESMRIADSQDGIDLICVDYLQILKAERMKGQSREEVVANLSGGLKQLAKTMGCPVITASQVNKNGDTRESEAIAFDSDVMLAIGDDGIRLAKVRNGKRDILLHYQLVGELQTFVPFQPEDAPPKEVEDKKADSWARQNGRGKGGRDNQFKQ